MGYIVWQYVACQKGTQKVGRVYMAACGAVKRKPQIVMQAQGNRLVSAAAKQEVMVQGWPCVVLGEGVYPLRLHFDSAVAREVPGAGGS